MSATRTTPKELHSLVLLLDAALNDEGMPEQDRREALEDLRATAQDLMEEPSQEADPQADRPDCSPFRWDVQRSGETTVAVITGRLIKPGVPSVVVVRDRICAACTAWRSSCPEGRKAWERSAKDFNVGDLATYLEEPAEPGLVEALRQQGLVDLHIGLHCAGPDQADLALWEFDTALMDWEGG